MDRPEILPGLWLIFRSGEQANRTVHVSTEGFLIGREEGCDLVIADDKVSRKHAFLTLWPDGQVMLQDLDSTNGTWVDGNRLTESVPVRGGEVVKVGDTLLELSRVDPHGAPSRASERGLSRVGTTIARYRIERLIAEGGMGVVYLAEHIRLGTKVALKVLSPRLAKDQRFRQRFEREWRTAASLRHPNILPVYDADEVQDILYIAMPFVEGEDLHSLIERSGALDPPRTLAILEQVAGALDAAHALGLVHRDVKPGNILVASGTGSETAGHAYLCDFGISKRTASGSAAFTLPGHPLGTVQYMAPEQVTGEPGIDGRADVYALGCVLYQCLTGTVPFERDSEQSVMYAHVHEPVPSVRAHDANLPAGIDTVIAKAMAKGREDRFATCAQMVAAARAALAAAPAPAPAGSDEPTARSHPVEDEEEDDDRALTGPEEDIPAPEPELEPEPADAFPPPPPDRPSQAGVATPAQPSSPPPGEPLPPPPA